MYIDVGRIRPVGRPEQETDEPTERTIGREVLQDLYLDDTLTELQQHVEGLTLGIPDVRIEELPKRL